MSNPFSAGPERSRGTYLHFAALRSIRTALLVIVLASAAPAFAGSTLPPAEWADRQLPDASQEAQAKVLMEELRCLVCQGQSIADSDAELAGDMRHMVRSRIAAGQSPGQVRRWLVERYGNWVSYEPPLEPATWALWLTPLILLALGGWLARARLRRRT